MSIDDVPSPCINICKLIYKDGDTDERCVGCDRTIDEITRWRLMDNESRQAVIDGIVERNAIRKAHVSKALINKPLINKPR